MIAFVQLYQHRPTVIAKFKAPTPCAESSPCALRTAHESQRRSDADAPQLGNSHLRRSRRPDCRSHDRMAPSLRRNPEQAATREILEAVKGLSTARATISVARQTALHLTADDIAARLSVSRARAYELMREMPRVTCGRSVRVSETAFHQYMRRCTVGPRCESIGGEKSDLLGPASQRARQPPHDGSESRGGCVPRAATPTRRSELSSRGPDRDSRPCAKDFR